MIIYHLSLIIGHRASVIGRSKNAALGGIGKAQMTPAAAGC
jgi:hypothetical protein